LWSIGYYLGTRTCPLKSPPVSPAVYPGIPLGYVSVHQLNNPQKTHELSPPGNTGARQQLELSTGKTLVIHRFIHRGAGIASRKSYSSRLSTK